MYDIVNDDEVNIERILEWYYKTGDCYLAGEEEIKTLILSDLRKIFNVTDIYDPDSKDLYDDDFDPYMYLQYPVTQELAQILQPHFEHQIQLNDYTYYISAYTRS